MPPALLLIAQISSDTKELFPSFRIKIMKYNLKIKFV